MPPAPDFRAKILFILFILSKKRFLRIADFLPWN
jgi:hypothetical protein